MTKRWDVGKGGPVEAPDVDAFLAEIVEVCRKHGMSLGHEDQQGAFQVYRSVVPAAVDWLLAAHVAPGLGR